MRNQFIRIALGGAALSAVVGLSPAAMAAAQPRPYLAEITKVSPSEITVQPLVANQGARPLSTGSLSVRLGPYPVVAGDLRAGEQVWVRSGPNGEHLRATVLPVARGELETSPQGWIIAMHHGISFRLQNLTPKLLGMSKMANDTRVLAFGETHQNTLTAVALAAQPRRVKARVQSNQNRTFKLAAGTETWTYSYHNPRWQTIPVGATVGVWVNPESGKILAVSPHTHHAKLSRTEGSVASVSAQALVLKNPLGTLTIPLQGLKIAVHWKNHDNATLSQLSPGMRVMVRKDSQKQILHVMVKSPET